MQDADDLEPFAQRAHGARMGAVDGVAERIVLGDDDDAGLLALRPRLAGVKLGAAGGQAGAAHLRHQVSLQLVLVGVHRIARVAVGLGQLLDEDGA